MIGGDTGGVSSDVLHATVHADRIVQECLGAIAAHNSSVNAVVEVFADEAMDRARGLESQPGNLPLRGVPILLKDNICFHHGRTTAGSRMLKDYRSPFSATVVERLEAAGAIIVGKTNMDEFGMGSASEYSVFGPARNPWDLMRTPGGSSGGSAAAIAAGMLPGGAALGSDTGGSIRQPASMCNLVGYKPSYGLVSRYGLIAYASSLDQIGPITRTVEEAARIASVIIGPGGDERDSTCRREPVPDLLSELHAPIGQLRVGVPRQVHQGHNHAEVDRVLSETIQRFKGLGASIVELDLPVLDHAIAAYYIIAPAEASSNLARYDGVRYGHRAKMSAGDDIAAMYSKSRSEGFGDEVKRRILIGTHVLSAGYADKYYAKAQMVRAGITRAFDEIFGKTLGGSSAHCDVVLMPTCPNPAWIIGDKSDPISAYAEDLYTVGVNLAGLPAISVPCGFAEGTEFQRRLPIGMQLVAGRFNDALLLRAALMLERAHPLMDERPDDVSTGL